MRQLINILLNEIRHSSVGLLEICGSPWSLSALSDTVAPKIQIITGFICKKSMRFFTVFFLGFEPILL